MTSLEKGRYSPMTYYELCQNWGIDPAEHLATFEWLQADPRDEQGKLTREVGIRKQGGVPEKLRRVHDQTGTHFYDEQGRLWTGKPSVSCMDVQWYWTTRQAAESWGVQYQHAKTIMHLAPGAVKKISTEHSHIEWRIPAGSPKPMGKKRGRKPKE
jgi:hypothetical protein